MSKKVVFISGASSGLGREIAKKFISEGNKVVAIARSKKELLATFSNFESEMYLAEQADVSDQSRIRDIAKSAIDKFGVIDVVINNAAVYPKVNFVDESLIDFKNAVDINIIGVAGVVKAFLPYLIRNRHSIVINVSSWAHLSPLLESAVYSASKGAVHSLNKAIAVDVAHKYPESKISFVEWIPGHLNTKMSDFTGIDPGVSASWCYELVSNLPEAETSHEIYDKNEKWLPPAGLKQRMLRKLRLSS